MTNERNYPWRIVKLSKQTLKDQDNDATYKKTIINFTKEYCVTVRTSNKHIFLYMSESGARKHTLSQLHVHARRPELASTET